MKYFPNPPPVDEKELGNYLYNELQRISESLKYPEVSLINFETLHASPSKPREGFVAYADGTDWQASEGLWYYNGSTWTKL